MTGEGPPQAFFDELGAAFRRLELTGRAVWGFASAFGRLDRVVRSRIRMADPAPDEVQADPAPHDGDRPQPGRLHGVVGAGAERWAAPWVTLRARVVARQVVERALGGALAATDEGLGAALEALRFLSARVEVLEGADARRHRPVDGMAWLVDPPDLAEWVDPVCRWIAAASAEAVPGAGPPAVLVGDCGNGVLAAALARAGHRVRAAEPRGAVAAKAAARGVDVHVGPMAELLAGSPSGVARAVVLAGVVDRASVDEVVELVALAADRLARGAPLVVVSAGAGGSDGWDVVARDLLPGRPLDPATWELLLRRAGCHDVETASGAAGFAVVGRR